MAPKSDASMKAKTLKDEGKTRHEARWELQKAYGKVLTKSRLSQLLSEHWSAEENQDTPATGLSTSSRERKHVDDRPQSPMKRKANFDKVIETMPDTDSGDSSNMRARDRLAKRREGA